MARHKITYQVGLATKFIGSRPVGNLWGVSEYIDGRRRRWVLEPQDSEEEAYKVQKSLSREAARENPFTRKDGKRVYKTKEGRTVRHATARKTVASHLLLARKKAKKQHKRLPRGKGRLRVASATIALHMGKRGHRRHHAAGRAIVPRVASTPPKRAYQKPRSMPADLWTWILSFGR